ncbi:MAG TPA: ribonuclease P protein component 1 [Candidatus Acidoferrales bacterium]|nr:ribonuclease P protein component 1 [Candidatus Acidoferrales bacterium]
MLMQITPQNILHHELIGLRVLVIDNANPFNVGLSATVVDESKNTFTIESDSGEKMIPKEHGIFEFILPDGQHTILNGDLLVARPEDRVVKNLLKMRKR